MKLDVEIAIVGGGPAGTTTALALAREAPALAPRTVLLEKARYPRDKPCAGALGARGDALLREIGVSIELEAAPIDGMSFRGIQGTVTAVPGDIGRVVRRLEFDHALARQAAARGVVVRDGVCVTDVQDQGRAGVLLQTTEGPLRAAVAVGCDGVGSLVRRSLGVGRGRWIAQVIEVDTEPRRGDGDRTLLHFDASDRTFAGYTWDFPTIIGGRPMVSRGVYGFKGRDASRFARVEDAFDALPPADVADVLAERLRGLGIDPASCPTKRYSERGFESLVSLACGRRMLVGEAAGIDGLTGEGIAQAIEYGVLAGRFLAKRLPGADPEAIDLAGWNAEVGESRLARDLRMRACFVPIFYGPRRSALQRFFVGSSSPLSVGARHFGAGRQSWLEVGEVAARAVVHASAEGLETILRRALTLRRPS